MSGPQGRQGQLVNQARPSRRLVIVATTVGILSLAPAALAMFMARLMTYGLYSWLEPQLDANIWLPLLGFSLSLCLGPAIMTLGPHRRRWLRVTLGVFVAAAVIGSLATWVPVAA